MHLKKLRNFTHRYGLSFTLAAVCSNTSSCTVPRYGHFLPVEPLLTAKFNGGAVQIAGPTVSPKCAFKLPARRRLRAVERVTCVPWSAPIRAFMFSPAHVACRPTFAECVWPRASNNKR